MGTIHLISHTHWDREWYLTFQQFRFKLIHLMDSLLDILENNQDYLYFLLDGQAIILEDYLEICPDRANEIIDYIKQGRILIGPWYISPDEFLISGEAHIRNLLEGDRICKKYGGKMEIGYLPDTFGHIGQMPQILHGFGINKACAWRGLDDQPCELIWEAPDGSGVLLAYLRESYSDAANLTVSNPKKFINDIDELSSPLSENSLTNQILLMNGTDHMEPSSEITRALKKYQTAHLKDMLFHSNLPNYFKAVQADIRESGIELPKVIGELRSPKRTALLPNVLSTRIPLKQRNRKCENELIKWVEPLFALLNLYEVAPNSVSSSQNSIQSHYQESQKSIIQNTWKLLMKCHPHDSICGTSIDQVNNEMMIRFDQVDQINHEMVETLFQELCGQIDTSFVVSTNSTQKQENMIASIIVFNPNDVIQTGRIDIWANIDKQYTSFNIIDESGASRHYEQIGLGGQELISMTLDKKSMKQAIRTIHEGNVAGMVVRNFEINRFENYVEIRVILSDHGLVDVKRWNDGVEKLEGLFNDLAINEFIIHAYSDPETRLSFIANDVPSHGYRCYWIQGNREELNKQATPQKISPLARNLLPLVNLINQIPLLSKISLAKKEKSTQTRRWIENEFFIVEVQLPYGTISITDKLTNQSYEGQNYFLDSGDCGDVYNYCPPENNFDVSAKVKSYMVEESIIEKKIVITYEMIIPAKITDDRKSRSKKNVTNTIISTVSLLSGLPRIDFHTEVDNRAMDHRLKVHFPAPFQGEYSYHDGHYEIVKREIGLPKYDETWAELPSQDVPQGDFTFIKSGDLSFTIANLGLPEVEVSQNKNGHSDIALTLLRCVGWLSRDDLSTRKGHAGPMAISTPRAQMIGKFTFDYSIIPGGNDLTKSIQQAYAFKAPLKSTTSNIHSGKLPPAFSFIRHDNQDFLLTTIKLSEIGRNLIVRGYNRLPSPIAVNLKLWRTFKHAYLADLNENITEEIPISPEGYIKLNIDAKKIITLKFSD